MLSLYSSFTVVSTVNPNLSNSSVAFSKVYLVTSGTSILLESLFLLLDIFNTNNDITTPKIIIPRIILTITTPLLDFLFSFSISFSSISSFLLAFFSLLVILIS